MTPRQKAARRAEEIEKTLENTSLSADKRRELESELGAIADNMSDGCYSNDPDDGIDWSDCPGISIPVQRGPRELKFYCPPMSYKLYYQNDEGRTTYDDHIPSDIIPMYRDRIAEALEQVYVFRLIHPNVTNVTPDVEVHDGKLHGIFNVSLNMGLTPEETDKMRDVLTGKVAEWSIYFEGHRITTNGGNLYARFYDSPKPIMTETAFNNHAYVEQHSAVFGSNRFYEDESGDYLRNMYYNPDSNAGGQLVHNYLYLDVIKEAFAECKTEEAFWERLDERASQYLTDIDTPEFAEEARCFVEEPCDFSGREGMTMNNIRNWVDKQTAEIERSHGMNMGQ